MKLKFDTKKIKSNISWIISKISESPLYWRTLIILLLIAVFVKWIIIYFSYKNLNPLENVVSYLASDLIVIFIAHFLIILNYWIKKRERRLFNDILVFIILLLYVIDMFTIFVFHSRISIIDAFVLWSNWSSWFNWIIRLWIFVFIITWFITFLLVQSKMKFLKKSWKNMVIVFSICSFIYALFYIIIMLFKIDINYVEDILSLNIQKFKEAWSELDWRNIDELDKSYHTEEVIWKWKDLNIILVFDESISAIDSANVGWNDKMPKFDEIQKDGITFTNFVTNWTTSDTAHISTLLWVIPLINMRLGNTPYSWYKLKMQALPEFMNSQWYKTTFISAVSLDFLKQREFLSWAWFQKIIWEEEFVDNKKYTFESAPDGDLYDRVLQEVQAQTWKYFIWLQTISFHKPYNVPYWKTEEKALKYSDDELYEFYQWLKNIWFFDSWILVIVGDHRKMNAIEDWEYEKFWPNRYTKSVATVVWSWIQSWTINEQLVQHTDFYNSLKRLVWKWTVPVDYLYNDIFTQESNRDRWITNSEFYENNRYTVSSYSWDIFLFKNISNLPKDSSIYDYFSSYISFEFWDYNNEKRESDSTDNSIKFIWHRGNIENSPENTLESFLSANELWADWIEFDVSYTKDQENIVAHWNLLYASNCKSQKVWNLNFDWIQKNCTMKNWEKYMKLQKMLELIDWLFDYYFLEIKVYDEKLWAQQTKDAIQTVKDLNMQDRVVFISYSDSAREVLNEDPDIIYGWDTFDIKDLDFIWENNSSYFLAPYDILTPEVVEKAKSLWKKVVTYTVNETWAFNTVKDLWVNIIMTDTIGLLKEYNSGKSKFIQHNSVKLNLKKSSRIISEDFINKVL